MGGAGLSGLFQCDDFALRAKSCADKRHATLETVCSTSDCGHADLDDLRRKRARRTARSAKRRNDCDSFLAFLAALVSASVFSFLLRGAWLPGSSGESEMARRKTDRVRSRFVWRASNGLAGTIRHSAAQ